MDLGDEHGLRQLIEEGQDSLKEVLGQLQRATERFKSIHLQLGAVGQGSGDASNRKLLRSDFGAGAVGADLRAQTLQQMGIAQEEKPPAAGRVISFEGSATTAAEEPEDFAVGDAWECQEEDSELEQKIERPLSERAPGPAPEEPHLSAPVEGYRREESRDGIGSTSTLSSGVMMKSSDVSDEPCRSPKKSLNFRAAGSELWNRITTFSGISSLAKGGDGSGAKNRKIGSRVGKVAPRRPNTSHLETASAILIVLNTVWMAVDVDLSIRSASKGLEAPSWLFWGDLTFVVFFSAEIALWLYFSGSELLERKQLPWHMLSWFILLVDLSDIIIHQFSPGFLRSIRVLRLIRTLRLLRVIRNVRQLRIMATSIYCSMSSLGWALVVLFLVMLVTAICLAQTLETHIRSTPTHALDQALLRYYGTLGMAALSLFMAITGGVDWAELLAPLESISVVYVPAFALFVGFVTVGMLNVLTALFVESIHHISDVDSDLAISEQMRKESGKVKKMCEFFDQADCNKDGSLTKIEFEAAMQDPHFRAHLQTLDLNVWSVNGLFRILNATHDSVQIEELVFGLMRLKGNVKAVDIVMLFFETKRNHQELSAELSAVVRSVEDLRSHLPGATAAEVG